MTIHPVKLIVLDGYFAVCKLNPDSAIPRWASDSPFFTITRTRDELSIVCLQDVVPAGILCERDWLCLRVAGAMPFTTVGVLASLTVPLAEAGVSVFVFSTYDTDYLLVKEQKFDAAIATLERSGHSIN